VSVKPFVAHCPLLLETDWLRLAPYLSLRDRQLADITVGAYHGLGGSAMSLLTSLAQGVQYGQLQELAHRTSVSDMQLQELLGFLNHVGGLERKRKVTACMQASWRMVSYLLLGITFSPLSHRYPCKIQYLIKASLRATTPVILAAGVVAGLDVAAGLLSPRSVHGIATCLLIFVGSIVLHETGHYWVIARKKKDVNVLQHGPRISLIHQKLSPLSEINSALAGPGVALGLCLAAWLMGLRLGQPVVAYGSLTIAALHVLSLVPLYGDGASLVAAIKERHCSR
jgi:hypothetical protein